MRRREFIKGAAAGLIAGFAKPGSVSSATLAARSGGVSLREFLSGSGTKDDSAGWAALARYAAQNPQAWYFCQRGDVYRLDALDSLRMPDGIRLQLDGATVRRTLPLVGNNQMIVFGQDAAIDKLSILIEPSDRSLPTIFNRLVRFGEGCRVQEITLAASIRQQNSGDPLDGAIRWTGTGRDSMRGAGFDRAHFENIDRCCVLWQAAAGPGRPTPARDMRLGEIEGEKVRLLLQLRNVSDTSVAHVRFRSPPEGGDQTANGLANGYAVLLEGVQNVAIGAVSGFRVTSHVVRFGGKRGHEQPSANVQFGTIRSRESRRCVFKIQPGHDRVRNISIGEISAIDTAGYDPANAPWKLGDRYNGHTSVVTHRGVNYRSLLPHSAEPDTEPGVGSASATHWEPSTAPNSNEEAVRIDSADNVKIGSVSIRKENAAFSCYTGVTLASAKNCSIGQIDCDSPFRHHLEFLDFVQGKLPGGPIRNNVIGRLIGTNANAENISVAARRHDFAGNTIGSFRIQGGTDLFRVRGKIRSAPNRFHGTAAGYSGRLVNLLNEVNGGQYADHNLVVQISGTPPEN